MFNQILLAADGSEYSLRAAEKVIYIAGKSTNPKVTILYVVDGSTSKSDVLRHWDALDIEGSRKEKLKGIEEKVKVANIDFEIKIIHGEPGPEIVKYANQHEFDLVVIGSRGLNKFQEMVLGSVSHKVAKRTNCPVMIVK